jgi:penicillin-binding protein 1C
MKRLLPPSLLPWLRLALAGAAGTAAILVALPGPQLLDETPFSSCYTDRDGKLLRLGLASDDRYRVYVPLEKISPVLVEMTLLHEDRFFREHAGFNAVSLARASWSALTHTGPRVGASTITMQLVRLHYHLNTRTPWGKFCQILAAIHMEVHCSKHDILEAYLNTAPYGRNIEGAGAASLIYFGKEPADLSPVEALTLTVIPQSPARRAPGSPAHDAALRKAREVLLTQWLTVHPEDARLRGVLDMPLEVMLPKDLPFGAPHLVDEMMLRQSAPRAEVRLTLDGDLQAVLEREVGRYVATHAQTGIRNACALLVDYRTMEIKAAVGSANYREKDIQGQVDGLRMQRSPGSALKPFVYALALDEGLIHPNSLLKDAPTSFAGYDPENFDHEFAGPIRARDALIQSRNIPAVDLESRLAPDRNLYTLLRDTGVRHLQTQAHYGLTIALGSAEVSPEELASLYAMLANRGRWQPLHFLADQPGEDGRQMMSPEAAYLTLDMLKDAVPPGMANLSPLTQDGRPVAWKTGTSFSYRDAWSAGVFDHDVLVVWVGNFNGAVNAQFVGRTAAAPFPSVAAGRYLLHLHAGPEPEEGLALCRFRLPRGAELPPRRFRLVHPGQIADHALRHSSPRLDRQSQRPPPGRLPGKSRRGAHRGLRILAFRHGQTFPRGRIAPRRAAAAGRDPDAGGKSGRRAGSSHRLAQVRPDLSRPGEHGKRRRPGSRSRHGKRARRGALVHRLGVPRRLLGQHAAVLETGRRPAHDPRGGRSRPRRRPLDHRHGGGIGAPTAAFSRRLPSAMIFINAGVVWTLNVTGSANWSTGRSD